MVDSPKPGCSNSCPDDLPELQSFRASWKQELNRLPSTITSKVQPESKVVKIVAQDKSDSRTPEEFNDSPFPFQFTDSLLRSWKDSPESKTESEKRYSEELDNYGVSTPPRKIRRSLVDVFIDDLNELNDIPFFDISIPKEIALKIFSSLSVKDLCACAQMLLKVSKAWQAIAEDDQLWKQMDQCTHMDFSSLDVTADFSQKVKYRELYIQSKRLRSNWKEHKCQIRYYHHARGGVLTSVHSSADHVITGYTNGQVKLWNVRDQESQTFQPSCSSLNIIDENEEASLGTTCNFVTCVHVGASTNIIAGYNHGHVQVWRHADNDCPRVREFRGQQIRNVLLSEGEDIAYVHHSNGMNSLASIKVLHTRSIDCDNHLPTVNDIILSSNSVSISRMPQKALFNVVPDSTNSLAVYVNGNDICTHTVSRQANTDEFICTRHIVEQFYGVHFTCLRSCVHRLCAGMTANLGITAEYKVRCYDTGTWSFKYDLCGHTSQVTCVDPGDSTEHWLVCTGCHDRRVRLFDTRLSTRPAIVLSGSSGSIQTVQLDDWKVASGDTEGLVCVWDQRMTTKLWEYQSRHPVKYLKFTKEHLISANIPTVLFPDEMDSDHMTHLRYRGSLQVSDFNVDHMMIGIPEVCSSNYDKQEGSNYNLGLTTPYDKI